MNIGITGISKPSEPSTLSDQAFRRMQQMIIEGELPPGHWLRKRQISSLLNMSPTPVIEALRRLQHDGLVDINPRWGARVKIWTVAEIAQLADMRIALEGTVARRAAETLDSEQVAMLKALAITTDEMDSELVKLAKSDLVQSGAVFQQDLKFHLTLARETGLKLIEREINRLRVLQATCRVMVKPTGPTTVTHAQIMEAIATQNGETAELTMRRHIQCSAEHYLPRLRLQFGDGPVVWRKVQRAPEADGESAD